MSLTLAIADLADGTGATATISGSSAGGVSVYVARVTGEIGTAAWALGGTRTGDGTASLALASGFYFAYAVEGSALSALVYFGVTDGRDAVALRIRTAVAATLTLLNLPCSRQVVTVWDDRDRLATQPPLTFLSTAGTREAEEPYTNALDGIGRTVRLVIYDVAVHPMNADPLPDFEKWRQAYMRAFRNQRINVPECRFCTIEPDAVLAEDERKGMRAVSAFTLKVHTRESRGLGA